MGKACMNPIGVCADSTTKNDNNDSSWGAMGAKLHSLDRAESIANVCVCVCVYGVQQAANEDGPIYN